MPLLLHNAGFTWHLSGISVFSKAVVYLSVCSNSLILLYCVLFFKCLQPGSSLEQTHIFVLAHILRRPIIVYGVKYYKSFRGETLGYTRFQGEQAVLIKTRLFYV